MSTGYVQVPVTMATAEVLKPPQLRRKQSKAHVLEQQEPPFCCWLSDEYSSYVPTGVLCVDIMNPHVPSATYTGLSSQSYFSRFNAPH
jgi:hypothetical protein